MVMALTAVWMTATAQTKASEGIEHPVIRATDTLTFLVEDVTSIGGKWSDNQDCAVHMKVTVRGEVWYEDCAGRCYGPDAEVAQRHKYIVYMRPIYRD